MVHNANIYLVLDDQLSESTFNPTKMAQPLNLMQLPAELRGLIFDKVFERTHAVDVEYSTCLVSPTGQHSATDIFIPGVTIPAHIQHSLDEINDETVPELRCERQRDHEIQWWYEYEGGNGMLLVSRLLSSEAIVHAYEQTVFVIKSPDDLVRFTRSIQSFDAAKYVKRLKLQFSYDYKKFDEMNSLVKPCFIRDTFKLLQYVDTEFCQGSVRYHGGRIPLYADINGPSDKVGNILYMLLQQLHGLRNLKRVRVRGLACSSLAQAIASTLVGEPCLHLITDEEIRAENPDCEISSGEYSVAVAKSGQIFDFDYEDQY